MVYMKTIFFVYCSYILQPCWILLLVLLHFCMWFLISVLHTLLNKVLKLWMVSSDPDTILFTIINLPCLLVVMDFSVLLFHYFYHPVSIPSSSEIISRGILPSLLSVPKFRELQFQALTQAWPPHPSGCELGI